MSSITSEAASGGSDSPGAASPSPARTARETSAGRARALRLVALAALAVLAGCSLDVQQPKQVLFEATLEAVSDSTVPLSGNVAAVARDDATELGIELTGGQEGDRWIWRLLRGTCSSPGDLIGTPETYPVLESQDDPTTVNPLPVASSVTVVGTSLQEEGDYLVRVAAEATPDSTLLCGELTTAG